MGSGHVMEMIRTLKANRELRKSRNTYFDKDKLKKVTYSQKAYAFKKCSLAELGQRKRNRKVKFAAERKLRWLKTVLALVISALILKGTFYILLIVF